MASAEPFGPLGKLTFSYLPPRHVETLWSMLSTPMPVTPDLLVGGRIITDAANPGARDFAQMQVLYRRNVVEQVPPAMLVN